MYTHVHIYIYIYICACIYIYIYSHIPPSDMIYRIRCVVDGMCVYVCYCSVRSNVYHMLWADFFTCYT